MPVNKRLLLLTPFFSPNIGGVETFLDDLIQHIQERNPDQVIDVVTYSPLTTPVRARTEKTAWGTIYRCPYVGLNLFYHLERRPAVQFGYLSFGLLVYSLPFLLSRRYACINTHGMAASFLTSLFRPLLHDKRLVATIHTNYRFAEQQGLARKFAHWILARADHLLIDADGCKDDLTALGVTVPGTVYYNWVDEEVFKPAASKAAVRACLGIPENTLAGVFVGRFNPEKGIKELMESLELIRPDRHIYVIGSGRNEAEVQAACGRFPNAHFVGRVSLETLVDYYTACDILAFASIDESYLARTSIEALNCGLPLLTCKTSSYAGRERPVTLRLPETIASYFEPGAAGFAAAFNTLDTSRFSQQDCMTYVKSVYGRATNANRLCDVLCGDAPGAPRNTDAFPGPTNHQTARGGRS